MAVTKATRAANASFRRPPARRLVYSAQRSAAVGSRCRTRLSTDEYSHLRRRPHFGVLRPDRKKSHGVPESLRDVLCPVPKLLARPFEAVVPVPELSGGQ